MPPAKLKKAIKLGQTLKGMHVLEFCLSDYFFLPYITSNE